MAPLDFEILSKLMRYVFTFLGVLIVWRSFAWLRKDGRETHRRVKSLPDAGSIGLFTVLRGSSELKEGDMLPVPWEGVLGFVRTCDIVVPVTDVVAQHLDFTFRNGKGLYIYPRRGCPAAVDGVTIDSRADSHRYPMRHGSILQVGEALLQLGVFAGLEVEQASGVFEPGAPGEAESAERPYVIQNQAGSCFQPPCAPQPGPYAPPYAPQAYPDAPPYPPQAYPDAPPCPPQSTYAPSPYPQQGNAGFPPLQPPQGSMYASNPYPQQGDSASLPVLTPPERRPGDEG